MYSLVATSPVFEHTQSLQSRLSCLLTLLGHAGAVPGQLKGYTLYGKEGTLHLDLDAGKLLLGLKSEGGQLKEVSIDSEKSGVWRVCTTHDNSRISRVETPMSFCQYTCAMLLPKIFRHQVIGVDLLSDSHAHPECFTRRGHLSSRTW